MLGRRPPVSMKPANSDVRWCPWSFCPLQKRVRLGFGGFFPANSASFLHELGHFVVSA